MKKLLLISCAVCFLTACGQPAEHLHEPVIDPVVSELLPDVSDQDIAVYFISPQNGDSVRSPVNIIFGLKGMGIAPAGSNIDNTGHHHLIIDTPNLPDLTKPLAASDKLIHFGKGQTQTSLELPEGLHTLQLVLADFSHTPHAEPVVSKLITIHVEN